MNLNNKYIFLYRLNDIKMTLIGIIIALFSLLQFSYCSFNEASRILSNHTLDTAGSTSAHY